MVISSFLEGLLWEGRACVGRPAEMLELEYSQAEDVLARFEQVYRQDLPGDPPPLDLPSARWAAIQLWRACQLIAFRELGTESFAQLLGTPIAAPNNPAHEVSQHYSVDLTFRFLPDVFKQAKSAAEHDPLLEHLERWARQWPLSSVGVPGIPAEQVAPIVSHACLRKLYVDRILSFRAMHRLTESRVREAVREALGLYPQLAPAVAAELEQPKDSTS